MSCGCGASGFHGVDAVAPLKVNEADEDGGHLGGLYMIAYCHRRRDVRMFAVERIRSLTTTDHPYQLPLGFDVEAYVQDALVVMRGRQIEVELLFDRVPLLDVRVHTKLRVADTRELIEWILGFGRGAKVVRPVELHERVRREALAVSRQ